MLAVACNEHLHLIGLACLDMLRLNSELPLAQMYLMRRRVFCLTTGDLFPSRFRV